MINNDKIKVGFFGKFPKLSTLRGCEKFLSKEVINHMMTEHRKKLYEVRLKALRDKDEATLRKRMPNSQYTVQVDTVNLDEVVRVYFQEPTDNASE